MLAGACGFLNKAEPADVILRAIECVQQGQIWLDRSTTARVVASFYDRSKEVPALADQPGLTPAERRIVAAVAKYKGSPNKVIADALHISAHTLRNHLASIYGKLGLHSRVDLVLYAMDNGLDVEVTAPRALMPPTSRAPQMSGRSVSHPL